MAALEGTLNNKFASINHKHTIPDDSGAPNITYVNGTDANAQYKYTTPGTYTLTVPTKVTQMKVTTVGGGAPSSYCSSYNKDRIGDGGGGGAVTENISVAVTAGSQITIYAGKGGICRTQATASYITYNDSTYAYAGGGNGTSAGGAGGGNGGTFISLGNATNGIAGRYGAGGSKSISGDPSYASYVGIGYFGGGGGSWGAGNTGQIGAGGIAGVNGGNGAVWINFNNVEQHYTGPAIQDNPVVEPTYDPNTLLLLHGEDFTDSSQYGRAVTNNGSAITADGKFGKALKGSGAQSVRVEILALGTGDFTIDFWTRMDGVTSYGMMCGTSYGDNDTPGGFIVSTYSDTRKLRFYYTVNGTYTLLQETSYVIPLNTWTHIALVRNNGVTSIYANGVKQGEKSGTVDLQRTLMSVLQGNYGTSYYYNGAIDEFRVSDIARWTGNFTPPTAPYSN